MCAGFNQVDIEYDAYRKRFGRLKNKMVASNLSHIVVRDGSIVTSHLSQIVVRYSSTSSPSIMTIRSGETAIFVSPRSQVVNLVTPSIAMMKASSVEIETTITIPRDTIRRKTGCRLQQHNAEK